MVYNYLGKQVKTNYGQVSEVKNPEKPRWSDVVDPTIAAKALLNSFNESPMYKLAQDADREQNKNDGNIGTPVGKFVGNFLNLGGFLKNYQLNSDAIKALQGKPTRMTKAEYDKIKPEGFIDAFMYNSLNTGLYKEINEFIKKDNSDW